MSGGETGPAATVALAFLASLVGSVVFAAAYLAGGPTALLGGAMALALGGLGVGLVLWSKRLMPQGPWEEAREKLPVTEEDGREAAAVFAAGGRSVRRRRLLGGLCAAAGGLLGLVALLPVRSLGPSPAVPGVTGWARGVRLVDGDGRPLRVDDLPVGGVTTAFPEGATRRAESQVVLVRVDDAALRAAPDRAGWGAGGNVAYSQLCTHAGCPVGMFQPDAHLLLCPCHQAAFDVIRGGRTVFGPAPRPLPQLPLDVDADGVLVARGDFQEPVGPDRWRVG